MSAMLCKKSTRNALRCVMILHSCLALGQTPPTTHQPQPTIHTKLSFCWCNHNWWKHSGSQNLHTILATVALRMKKPRGNFASFNVFILFHRKSSPCSGKFHQNAWMVSTVVDTQQHLPPSRRLRIWFSMIWRSSADRPSSSGRYPLLNYFTLRIDSSIFIVIHPFLSRTPNNSCRTFRKHWLPQTPQTWQVLGYIHISPCTAAAALELAVEIQAKSCWPISIQNLVVWMNQIQGISTDVAIRLRTQQSYESYESRNISLFIAMLF